jgi:hypothetical protein
LDQDFKNKLFSTEFLDDTVFNKGRSIDSVQIFLNLLYRHKFKRVSIFNLFKDNDFDDADFDFNDMDKYQYLMSRVSFIDNELSKILTFLVSHEFYHLNSNCVISKETEAQADAFGIMQYVNLVPSDFTSGVNAFQDIFNNMLREYSGRPIQEIFLGLYSDSSFKELNNSIYLPFPERVKKIDSLLLTKGIQFDSTKN